MLAWELELQVAPARRHIHRRRSQECSRRFAPLVGTCRPVGHSVGNPFSAGGLQLPRLPPRPHCSLTYSFGSSITCRISCRSSSIGATRAQRAHYALNFRLGSTVVYCHE